MTYRERVAAFPKGCRVVLSPHGIKRGISKRAGHGVVVGHSFRFDALIIKRDGRRAPGAYHWSFWMRNPAMASMPSAVEEHW